MLRAKDTAQYIAKKTDKDIVFSELFAEVAKLGEIDGKPWTDVAASTIWRARQETLSTPGQHVNNGENYADVIARVDKALAFLEERPEAELAVVTHGYFLRAMVARVLLGDNLSGPILRRFQERTSTQNTGITVLNYEDKFEEDFAWRLWTFNDHSHFAE